MLSKRHMQDLFRIYSIQLLQHAARNNGCMPADALHQKIIYLFLHQRGIATLHSNRCQERHGKCDWILTKEK